MTEKPPEFWNLDLTRLTWRGWLLILLAIGTVMAVSIPLLGLLTTLVGGRGAPGRDAVPRWMGIVAVVVGVGAGSAVFELGRRLLLRAGFPITRPPKPPRGLERG